MGGRGVARTFGVVCGKKSKKFVCATNADVSISRAGSVASIAAGTNLGPLDVKVKMAVWLLTSEPDFPPQGPEPGYVM